MPMKRASPKPFPLIWMDTAPGATISATGIRSKHKPARTRNVLNVYALGSPPERHDRDSCEGQNLADDRPRLGGLPVMNDAEESHCQDHESVEYEGSGSGRNELVSEGNRERVEAKEESPNQVRPTSKGTGEGAREGHSQEEQHPESAHESNDRQ